MHTPTKRTLKEFERDYHEAFPLSPAPKEAGYGIPIGGWGVTKRKEEKYDEDLQMAWKVASWDPSIDRSRYMPGAYPDGVILPGKLEVPQIVAWSSEKLIRTAVKAKNTYTMARNAYQTSRRAAAATRDVVISVVGVVGTAKRRAVQVCTGLSNLAIIRRASRPPSSRVVSPSRRRRSPRPSPSSPLSPLPSPASSPSPLSGLPEPEPMDIDVGPSSHPAIETPLPLSTSATGEPEQMELDVQPSSHPVVETPELNNGTPPKELPKFKLITFRRRAPAIHPPMVLPLPPVVPPPVIFAPPTSTQVSAPALVVEAAPAEEEEPAPFESPSPTPSEHLRDIGDSFENEPEEDEEPAHGPNLGDEIEVPSTHQAVLSQTASSHLRTYNGHQDVSMQEASSLLLEISAPPPPPSRRVHWHESPRTGAPVSGTRVISPLQSSPFRLIIDGYPVFEDEDELETEAGPSGVRRDDLEDETVNEPTTILPTPQTLAATNGEILPVVVENATTTEVDAPLDGTSSVEAVQETLSILAVSQAVQDARKAARAAKRAKKQAEAKALAEEKALRKKKEEDAAKSRLSLRMPTKPIIAPLSRKWDEKVDATMRKQNHAEAATLPDLEKLLVRDFATACPRPNHREDGIGYLNDSVIEGYLQLVTDHANRVSGKKMSVGSRSDVPRMQHMNSFFYSKIRDSGVETVKRWSAKKKIAGKKLLQVERLFIPVHQAEHWTLLVLSPKARTIQYYDSLGGSGRTQIANIKLWLAMELGNDYIPSEWKVLAAKSSMQANGIDCGVFTVTNAKMISLGIDPRAFKSQDAALQRRRMLAELMNRGFSGDFEPDVTFAE